MTTIGPMFSAADLESAVETTLKTWMETYLHAMEQHRSVPAQSYEFPRAWVKDARERTYAEDQVPAIIIVAGGAQDPERHGGGGGRYTAWFTLSIGVVVSAFDKEITSQLCKDYIAVVRTLIVQNASLDGVAQEVRWMEEHYEDGGTDGRREYAAGVCTFLVAVNDVLDAGAGMLTPPSDPYGTLPGDVVIESADATIDITRDEP